KIYNTKLIFEFLELPLNKNKTIKYKLKTKISHPYIWQKEGICGGVPVIKGTRISVATIAELEKSGMLVDEIVVSYPHLNHSQVYDALSYYYENKREIDKEIKQQNHELDILTQKNYNGSGKIILG
ncbi:MAG: DUF433 domain-containing protein, partial [Bacteroidota bacterium]|nr:DUF433 domain-containing protein [Bacteroidota bacterium]